MITTILLPMACLFFFMSKMFKIERMLKKGFLDDKNGKTMREAQGNGWHPGMIKLSSVTPPMTTATSCKFSSSAAMAWFAAARSVQSGAISTGPRAPEREHQLLLVALIDHLPFPRRPRRLAASQCQRGQRAAMWDGRRVRPDAQSRQHAQPRGAGEGTERAWRQHVAVGRPVAPGGGRLLEPRRQPGGRVGRDAAAGRRGVGQGGIAAAGRAADDPRRQGVVGGGGPLRDGVVRRPAGHLPEGRRGGDRRGHRRAEVGRAVAGEGRRPSAGPRHGLEPGEEAAAPTGVGSAAAIAARGAAGEEEVGAVAAAAERDLGGGRGRARSQRVRRAGAHRRGPGSAGVIRSCRRWLASLKRR
jgi:hypothetical protein